MGVRRVKREEHRASGTQDAGCSDQECRSGGTQLPPFEAEAVLGVVKGGLRRYVQEPARAARMRLTARNDWRRARCPLGVNESGSLAERHRITSVAKLPGDGP